MEDNINFGEEWEEGKLSKTLINSIAFVFGRYDEHDNYMKVKHFKAENQFYHLAKNPKRDPKSILDMGESSGALSLLFAFDGYRTQFLCTKTAERNIRLTKKQFNFDDFINVNIVSSWNQVNKLNVDTVIICDMPEFLFMLIEKENKRMKEFKEMLQDNKCQLIISNSEFPLPIKKDVELNDRVLDQIAEGEKVLYRNEGNLVIQYE